MPDYYGTGRQPKTQRSYVGLAVTLIVVLLTASAIPFVIPRFLQKQEPAERTAPQAERNLTLPQEDEPQQEAAVCGMLICELDEAQQRYWNLPNGVIVGQVEENSTAAAAGVLPGDVIVRIGDAAPDCAEDCRDLLTAYSDGEQVDIELYRSGEEIEVELTFGEE